MFSTSWYTKIMEKINSLSIQEWEHIIFYEVVKYHRCSCNGHGPVPLNNEKHFKFLISIYAGAANHNGNAFRVKEHMWSMVKQRKKVTAVTFFRCPTVYRAIVFTKILRSHWYLIRYQTRCSLPSFRPSKLQLWKLSFLTINIPLCCP